MLKSYCTVIRKSIGAIRRNPYYDYEVVNTGGIDVYSRIKDADMASKMVLNAKWNILQQTAQTMLSQNTKQNNFWQLTFCQISSIIAP